MDPILRVIGYNPGYAAERLYPQEEGGVLFSGDSPRQSHPRDWLWRWLAGSLFESPWLDELFRPGSRCARRFHRRYSGVAKTGTDAAPDEPAQSSHRFSRRAVFRSGLDQTSGPCRPMGHSSKTGGGIAHNKRNGQRARYLSAFENRRQETGVRIRISNFPCLPIAIPCTSIRLFCS